MAARGVNKVILVGHLGQDPDVRYMPNGGAVANLTLATSETWRDKQTGEMRENTEWHRVVIFGKLAEVAGEYRRWAGEFDARELAPAFWHWRSRYASLASLDWLRDAGEPLYGVMHEISFIVRETPESVRQAERWQVPNKLTHRSHG